METESKCLKIIFYSTRFSHSRNEKNEKSNAYYCFVELKKIINKPHLQQQRSRGTGGCGKRRNHTASIQRAKKEEEVSVTHCKHLMLIQK